MRILVVEDERSLARAIVKILEKGYYSADSVGNGADALEYLDCGNYDAVILDVMMPVMDGITALKKIRERGNGIPVLVLTAKSEVDDKVRGLDSGADYYLTKPFAAKELLARIRAMTRAATAIDATTLSVGNVRLAFEEHGRWLDGTQGAVPKPGYLVIYGVRQSTPYTHVAIVESVKALGGGLYELTTIEGNLNSTVRRLNYRYDANPKQPYRNMSVVPTDEITQENCQYTLQKDDWYVTGFCATW